MEEERSCGGGDNSERNRSCAVLSLSFTRSHTHTHTHTPTSHTGKSREAEVKRVNKELANIRSKFGDKKGLNGYQKKKYVCKNYETCANASANHKKNQTFSITKPLSVARVFILLFMNN